MPKVTEAYIQKKKQVIVDAAYRLCLEKTVSTVTMQDIINETGFSQGGIYRFYHDIDDIFRDMLIKMRRRVSIKEQADEIFAHADEMEPANVTSSIFDILADFMEQELTGIVKVDFEFNVLAMNSPKRIEKILSGIHEVGNKEYITKRTAEFFAKKMETGELQAKVTGEELISYISAAYAGIELCCIVHNCYHNDPLGALYQPRIQLRILAKTVNDLLGIEEGEMDGSIE